VTNLEEPARKCFDSVKRASKSNKSEEKSSKTRQKSPPTGMSLEKAVEVREERVSIRPKASIHGIELHSFVMEKRNRQKRTEITTIALPECLISAKK